MIVCMRCQVTMVKSAPQATAWVRATKKEHPVSVVRCPGCGAEVADVDLGRESHAEEPYPGDLVLEAEDV